MRVGLFLAIAFGVSWTFGGLTLLYSGDASPSAQAARWLLAIAFMFGPLVGAVVAQRAAGLPLLRPLGVAGRLNWWWLVAWLSPFAYVWLTLLCSLPLPGVSWSGDFTGFWERMSALLPPEQLEASRRQVETTSPWLFWLLIVGQPLLLGALINSLAACGEELGWRGFLYRTWARFGFWKCSFLIGAVWGIWHAPLVAQGHNYPQHPWLGVGLMVVWCVLLSPPFTWLRLRTGSVLAVAVAHGTLNASAGLAVMFIRGGNDLLVGVSGLAGMTALLILNALIAMFDRHLALPHEAPAPQSAPNT